MYGAASRSQEEAETLGWQLRRLDRDEGQHLCVVVFFDEGACEARGALSVWPRRASQHTQPGRRSRTRRSQYWRMNARQTRKPIAHAAPMAKLVYSLLVLRFWGFLGRERVTMGRRATHC